MDLLPDDFAIDEGESEEETKSEVFSSEIDFKPDKKKAKKQKAVDSDDEKLQVGRDPKQKARKFKSPKKKSKKEIKKKVI